MAKKREVSKELHYKKIIDKQKSIIRKLSKKASRADKIEGRYEDLEEREAELFLEEDKQGGKVATSGTCPNCKAPLDVIGGTKIIIYLCTECPYKTSVRK